MKLILTFLTVIGFSVQLHAQDESESERIKALISELSKKAVESRLQLKKLHSQFSENHPKIRGIESQLSEIANAKTELASKLAMIQLSDVHKELKNHASILTKQLASIKEMMKSKVDADFKTEYGKIQEHALKVIQMIKEHVNEKHIEQYLRDWHRQHLLHWPVLIELDGRHRRHDSKYLSSGVPRYVALNFQKDQKIASFG